jgi:hypothetical protein
MPLLDVVQKKKVVATISLEESTANNVDRYAAFINAPADDVVTQALDYVFSKDKDFQKYLETPDDKKAPQVLRVRKTSDDENRPKRGRKPATAK